MRVARRRVFAAIGLVLPLLSVNVGTAETFDVRYTEISTSGPASSVRAGRSDHISAPVVWVQHREDGYSDIYADDLLDDRGPFAVEAGGDYERTAADTNGHYVVYAESQPGCPGCNRDIVAEETFTGEQFAGRRFTIAATPADETLPVIADNVIAWVSYDGVTARLMACENDGDGCAEAPRAVAENVSLFRRPEVAGHQIVWLEETIDASGATQQRLLSGPGGDGRDPIVIAEGVWPQIGAFDVGEDGVIVYEFERDIIVDLTSGGTDRRINLSEFGLHGRNPVTDGYDVFFIEERSPTFNERRLWTYSLYSEISMVVDEGDVDIPSLGPRDSWLVWAHPQEDATLRAIPSVSPWSARLPSNSPGSEAVYFLETMHSLQGAFHAFWERSGGLAVFGYPITEEFLKRDQTAQVFERQRFEWHPENAGTPYEVLLGRLGVADAASRALLHTAPFDEATPRDDCTWFAETGHNVCGELLAYWRSHGLEFGDQGITFRESLALFGYPISEPFSDPKTGQSVQYFERTRFEYYPFNPDPWKVLLTRIGAECYCATDF